MHNQMTRDQIAVGIQDQILSQRMHIDPNLTLEKAKTLSAKETPMFGHVVYKSMGRM